MKLGGKDDDEKVKLLIDYLRGMNEKLNIPQCIKITVRMDFRLKMDLCLKKYSLKEYLKLQRMQLVMHAQVQIHASLQLRKWKSC